MVEIQDGGRHPNWKLGYSKRYTTLYISKWLNRDNSSDCPTLLKFG